MTLGFFVLLGFVAAPLLIGWLYFRRFALARPPIGVVDVSDVAIILVGVVVVPYLYLVLPSGIAAVVLGLTMASILAMTFEPLLRFPLVRWLVVLTLLGTDVGVANRLSSQSLWFLAVNNLVLIFAIVGASNLWAQSGLKARDATLLAAGLAIYDAIFTTRLPLMNDLVGHLVGLPFMPLLTWNVGNGMVLGAGLGDLLIATLIPLVFRKAFGRRAGLTALAVNLLALALLLALLDLGIVTATIPAMVVVGPLTIVQYAFWRRRSPERPFVQYLRAEPTS